MLAGNGSNHWAAKLLNYVISAKSRIFFILDKTESEEAGISTLITVLSKKTEKTWRHKANSQLLITFQDSETRDHSVVDGADCLCF